MLMLIDESCDLYLQLVWQKNLKVPSQQRPHKCKHYLQRKALVQNAPRGWFHYKQLKQHCVMQLSLHLKNVFPNF